jgi:rubrerythrin
MEKKEAYIFAIENEIKSKNFYAMLARSCKNEESKKTFYMLEKLEAIHEEKLIDAYKKECQVSSPVFDREMMPKIDIRRNLSEPKAVLEYAIDRELSMADQYAYMSETAEDQDMKKFFDSLYKEELDHKELLENELDRIHGIAIWFDESELNGLMEY